MLLLNSGPPFYPLSIKQHKLISTLARDDHKVINNKLISSSHECYLSHHVHMFIYLKKTSRSHREIQRNSVKESIFDHGICICLVQLKLASKATHVNVIVFHLYYCCLSIHTCSARVNIAILYKKQSNLFLMYCSRCKLFYIDNQSQLKI